MKMFAIITRNCFNSHVKEYKEVVAESEAYFPSGLRKVVRFADGTGCKVDNCKLVYVF